MLIRPERAADHARVHTLNAAAFGQPAEADLVNRLRVATTPLISLVAEQDDAIQGHILFSPVTLDEQPALKLMGLAPMAVWPALQKQGIGSALVRAGLAQCRALDIAAVVVLGHPGFYPRFGFRPGHQFDIDCVYDVPAEVFMLLPLKPELLRGASGLVHYHSAFDAF